jgi:SAM-dependent methyltransferase
MSKNKNFDNLTDYIPTFNAMGYMTKTLDHVHKAFIHHATEHPLESFLDIGCALGNTTLPLIDKKISVVACDLDQKHLDFISAHAGPLAGDYLTLLCAHFPNTVTLQPGSFRGIIMAMVLHFLEPEEVPLAFKKVYDLLMPGGVFFLTASSPYQGVLKNFAPIYEQKKNQGQPFPGLIEDISVYVPHRSYDLPKKSIVYAPDELEDLCKNARLSVKESGFFTRHPIPQDIAWDGREYSYIIVEK